MIISRRINWPNHMSNNHFTIRGGFFRCKNFFPYRSSSTFTNMNEMQLFFRPAVRQQNLYESTKTNKDWRERITKIPPQTWIKKQLRAANIEYSLQWRKLRKKISKKNIYIRKKSFIVFHDDSFWQKYLQGMRCTVMGQHFGADPASRYV